MWLCFPFDEQSTLLKGAEGKLRLCPFLPVFLLIFIIKATIAPMMATAPKTARAAMITMLVWWMEEALGRI